MERWRVWSRLFWDDLALDNVGQALAAADNMCLAAFNKYFRGKRFGIVVASHRIAVRSGATNYQEVADLCGWQGAAGNNFAFVLREKVSRLAKRSADDYVAHGSWLIRIRDASGRADCHWMIGPVENRSRKVIEAGV